MGNDPRLKESGQFKGKVKMTKRGVEPLRTAFFQAAFSASQHDPEFKAYYNANASLLSRARRDRWLHDRGRRGARRAVHHLAQVPFTKVIIDGRTPMKTYWVRSRAIGTAGPSPWSTVISIVAM